MTQANARTDRSTFTKRFLSRFATASEVSSASLKGDPRWFCPLLAFARISSLSVAGWKAVSLRSLFLLVILEACGPAAVRSDDAAVISTLVTAEETCLKL